MANIKDLPHDLLVDIFTCADLRTRIKIRRVCCYWKHVLLGPLTNQLIQVDWACFEARSWRRSAWSQYYQSAFMVRDEGEVPCLRGLLGKHVRHVIYVGRGLRVRPNNGAAYYDYPVGLPWLAQRTPQAETLQLEGFLFQLFGGDSCATFLRSLLLNEFEEEPPHKWRYLTLKNCDFLFALNGLSKGSIYWTVRVPDLTIELDSDLTLSRFTEALMPFLWPYPEEQVDWVRRNAPLLPRSYRRRPLFGTLREFLGQRNSYSIADVEALDYKHMPKESLLQFARCLIYHKARKNPSIPEPPFAFPDDFQ
ncbi:hypothetical protein BV898_11513 [Hypsibius exemplaris]|uniref:F-box domain-containing protein n=1 Tax=Hypsibius exemplaris TaxID=2072580 RepID=A0A1W0WGE4_HYPEX|nr:hypothetical protein BV898_11513 [Hypsibius exemplaris]